jgi:branched-chain amino acid transport system permease protein
MKQQTYRQWGHVLRVGLIGGVAALYLCLVGIVGTFSERDVIDRVLTLGHTLLFLTALGVGYVGARARLAPARHPHAAVATHTPPGIGLALLAGAFAGAVTGASLSFLLILGGLVNLRAVFLNASPLLYNVLTLGLGPAHSWVPLVGGVALGMTGALLYILPGRVRAPLLWGATTTLAAGLFAEVLRVILVAWPGWPSDLAAFLFGFEGLTTPGVVATFLVVSGGMALVSARRAAVRARIEQLPPASKTLLRYAGISLLVAVVASLPLVSGVFIAQVIVLIGLYVLMGLGLNVTLGFAGLFDLGFVAFFAIGAYTVGLLTSTGEHGIAGWPFWAALPFAVLAAMIAGVFLGTPVLGIRGDYLAIATLGFGEIVRLLVGSDFLRPYLGGSFGILAIPKPWIGNIELAGPQQLYYLVVIGSVLAAFIALRLRDSRLGRAWMAIREDEDVAEALGVNLVQTKLLAYSLGAAFAGLGGAIFATMVSSIFPHSMHLLVSINVVALLIVGGMGSIPGVIVGAAFLIGIPELFREFSEYRYLFYGAALIVMMLSKPEGLWPSAVTRRELHAEEDLVLTDNAR